MRQLAILRFTTSPCRFRAAPDWPASQHAPNDRGESVRLLVDREMALGERATGAAHSAPKWRVSNEPRERDEPFLISRRGEVSFSWHTHLRAHTDRTHDKCHPRGHVLYGLEPRLTAAPGIV